MKSSRLYIAALLIALLSACSSTTFVYNRLHLVIPWFVDDYVDLDKQQDDVMDQLLGNYLTRHRHEHLPRYVDIIDESLAMLDGPVNGDNVQALYARSQQELDRLQIEALDWMLPVGESLTDNQVDEFLANLRDKQEEYEKEYLERDDGEFRDEVYDNLKDNLSDYLGRLDKDQKQTLKQVAEKAKRWDTLWLEDREQWVGTLESLLKREPGWQQRVREAVAKRYEVTSSDYKAAFNHNLQLTLDGVGKVIASRSEKQDRRLRKELAGLRGDLCQLIVKGLDENKDDGVSLGTCGNRLSNALTKSP